MKVPAFLRQDAAVDKALESWQEWVFRNAWLVVATFLLLSVPALDYTVNNLGINSDTDDLLDQNLSWRQNYLAYKDQFPDYSNNLVILVEADVPDALDPAVAALAEKLAERDDLFEWVYLGQHDPFFRRQALLYLSLDDLYDLTERLAEVQPFIALLLKDPTLRGLTALVEEMEKARADGEALDASDLFFALAQALGAAVGGDLTPLSWQQLLRGKDASPDEKRAILLVRPKLDYGSILPGKTAVNTARQIAADLGMRGDGPVRVRVTGSVALSYEELDSVSRGAALAGTLALSMVTIVLLVGLGSLAMVVATVISLVVGLAFTASFAAATVGNLNLISVAFAVLYIGLGVDFAVHFCLGYRESLADRNKLEALRHTSSFLVRSLVLCAFTTAVGFFAFIPTSYRGVAELGLISGVGIFISLVVSVSLLPALLRILPTPRAYRQTDSLLARMVGHAVRYPRIVLFLTAVACVLGVSQLPKLTFDHNPVHLHDQSAEAVQTFNYLLEESERPPLSIAAMIDSRERLRLLAEQLRTLGNVDSVVTLENLIPKDQEDKLLELGDLALSLGPSLDTAVSEPPPVGQEREEALLALRQLLQGPDDGKDAESREALRNALDTYLAAYASASSEQRTKAFEQLEKVVFQYLEPQLARLSASLEAGVIDETTLPNELLRRWKSPGGMYRMEVFPRDDLEENENLEHFVASARSILGDIATGAPVINLEAARVVVDAFRQAFLSAFLMIAAILLLLLRSLRNTAFVCVPLAVAGLLTITFATLTGTPLNFANIIALPLLLGIGVDSAIHILHREQSQAPQVKAGMGLSTPRAVVVSALTTICGFGNLALSTHRGTSTMGVMLAIGIAATLVCTLALLPSLLTLANGNHKGATSAPSA